MRALARAVAGAYYASREAKGFPLLQKGTVTFSGSAEKATVPSDTVRMTKRPK